MHHSRWHLWCSAKPDSYLVDSINFTGPSTQAGIKWLGQRLVAHSVGRANLSDKAPPLTGASSKCTPRIEASCANLRLTAGAIELISMIISPLRAPSRTPCRPVTTPSARAEVGHMA